MTKAEAEEIERAIEEFDGAEWVEGEGTAAMRRTPEHIRFKPTIQLSHNGRPSERFQLRAGLAAELRRIAAYLEL